jgi:hypothetical protein
MMMSSYPSLLLSTYKTPNCPVLKCWPENFDLDAVKLPKFSTPSSTPLSPHRRYPNRLNAIRPTFTTVPGNHAILLLLRHQDHIVASSTTSIIVAVVTMPENCVVLPAITAAESTPPWPLPPAEVRQTLSPSLSLSLCKFCFALFGCLPIWLCLEFD